MTTGISRQTKYESTLLMDFHKSLTEEQGAINQAMGKGLIPIFLERATASQKQTIQSAQYSDEKTWDLIKTTTTAEKGFLIPDYATIESHFEDLGEKLIQGFVSARSTQRPEVLLAQEAEKLAAQRSVARLRRTPVYKEWLVRGYSEKAEKLYQTCTQPFGEKDFTRRYRALGKMDAKSSSKTDELFSTQSMHHLMRGIQTGRAALLKTPQNKELIDAFDEVMKPTFVGLAALRCPSQFVHIAVDIENKSRGVQHPTSDKYPLVEDGFAGHLAADPQRANCVANGLEQAVQIHPKLGLVFAPLMAAGGIATIMTTKAMCGAAEAQNLSSSFQNESNKKIPNWSRLQTEAREKIKLLALCNPVLKHPATLELSTQEFKADHVPKRSLSIYRRSFAIEIPSQAPPPATPHLRYRSAERQSTKLQGARRNHSVNAPSIQRRLFTADSPPTPAADQASKKNVSVISQKTARHGTPAA